MLVTRTCNVRPLADSVSTEVASAIVLSDGFFDPLKPLHIRWGELPHWRQDGASYFVTFRLADSLPQAKLAQWRRERNQWRNSHPSADTEELVRYSMDQRRRIERWLDQDLGSCILKIPQTRKIIEETLFFFDGSRYELGEFAIAPNHVHTLVRTASGIDLSEVTGSWKRHSSREISKLEQVSGIRRPAGRHLWQVECFDHIVRNQENLERFQRYITNHHG